MATGKGIKEARAALDAAQKKLQEAQAAAGVTPAPPPAAGETPTPPAAAGVTPAPPAAVGKTAAPPAAVGETPPADGATPPAGNAKLPRLKPPKLPAGANPPPPPADATAAAPTGVTPPADTSGKTPAGTPPPLPLAIQLGPAAKGGEGVIGSQGDRVIIRDKGQITIRHDDDVRFGGGNAKAYVQKGSDGTTISTIGRPNGDQIITTRNAAGDIIRRVRKGPDGTVEVLIGDRGNGNAPPPAALQGGVDFDFLKRLPKLVVPIPQKDYIVRSNQASQQQIEQALIAPPVERVERSYSLEEIRRSDRLREKLRRIDVDTVNFEFGAATVPYDQVPLLEVIGGALSSIISRNSDEVFLIEGHTDAVGSDFANLALSDRRAESVAEILTTYYGIPPENLITQGYGEGYLKILTSLPERENRRVTVRRITPLLRAGG
jgi:outer membrane protein OmpA-like peptidoglycan-associated protein